MAERLDFEMDDIQMTLLAGEAAQSILLVVRDGADLFGAPRLQYLCCERRADDGLDYFLRADMSEATWWPRADGGHAEVLADAKASAPALGRCEEMEIPLRIIEDKFQEMRQPERPDGLFLTDGRYCAAVDVGFPPDPNNPAEVLR